MTRPHCRNASCGAYRYVSTHIRTCHCTNMNTSVHTYEYVVPQIQVSTHIRTCHSTNMNTSVRTYEYVIAQIWIRRCTHTDTSFHKYEYASTQIWIPDSTNENDAQTCMGWLRLVGSLQWQASFAKEPYKRDYILQKRPVNLRSILIVATP